MCQASTCNNTQDTQKQLSKKTKGSHVLHKGPSKLQSMTALYQKLLQGVQGGMFHVFSKRVPLAAGGY